MELVEERVPQDPVVQFERWLRYAEEVGEFQPYAMALATVSEDGRPSARFIMLRLIDSRGFVFYTNYNSRKARELAQRPWGSLVFYWPKCERQVRVEGHVDRITREESDEYFLSRPRESQIEAWASPQGEVIPNRAWLEQHWEDCEAKFPGHVPRPDWWGGYRLQPETMEFWEQRPHRMHDRLLYEKQGEKAWSLKRLAP